LQQRFCLLKRRKSDVSIGFNSDHTLHFKLGSLVNICVWKPAAWSGDARGAAGMPGGEIGND
jgi:hypothetical protein